MGVKFGHDGWPYVSLECDAPECEAHVSVRPTDQRADRLGDAVELAEEAASIALADDWWVIGVLLCPRHVLPALDLMGLHVSPDGPYGPEASAEAVKPEAAAAAAQRGLTAVH